MAPNNIHTLSSKKKGSTAASAKKTGIYFGATNKAGNRVTQKLKPITNQQPKKGMQTLADMAADTHDARQERNNQDADWKPPGQTLQQAADGDGEFDNEDLDDSDWEALFEGEEDSDKDDDPKMEEDSQEEEDDKEFDYAKFREEMLADDEWARNRRRLEGRMVSMIRRIRVDYQRVARGEVDEAELEKTWIPEETGGHYTLIYRPIKGAGENGGKEEKTTLERKGKGLYYDVKDRTYWKRAGKVIHREDGWEEVPARHITLAKAQSILDQIEAEETRKKEAQRMLAEMAMAKHKAKNKVKGKAKAKAKAVDEDDEEEEEEEDQEQHD